MNPGTRALLRTQGRVLLIALLIYGLTVMLGEHTRSSGMAYFNELANSFLHGRLDVPVPSSKHDLTEYEGRWYLPFPPLPALLLLPGVALFGVDGVNAVLFSIVMASLGVVCVHGMLRALAARGLIALDARGTLWLTALFGLGTVYWSVAILGSVWYLGQVTSVALVAAAGWMAAERRPLAAGLALGAAILGRPNLILTAPFLWALCAVDSPRSRAALRLLLPAIAAVGALLLYNQARFGTPLDFGYRTANVPPKLAADLRELGQFHWQYVTRNLAAMLWLLPQWDAKRQMLVPNFEGMSLLLTTPAIVYLARARAAAGTESGSGSGSGTRWVIRGAWLSIGLLLLPLVSYYNTGWMQFGYRFSLDFAVPMIALLAIAAGPHPSRLYRALIVAGIAVNLWGVAAWMSMLRGF